MVSEARKYARRKIDCDVALSWQDTQGSARFARARGVDLSEHGARIETDQPLGLGAQVFVRLLDYDIGTIAQVRHCQRRGAKYIVGLELGGAEEATRAAPAETPEDCYELLQISPTAEMETVQRVYRMLAARYHPDNPHTGDAEKFLLITRAYQTLSDPEKRQAYDRIYQERSLRPLPVFELKEFVSGVDAESNRRFGILCLLYNRRRSNADRPGLSLLDLESLMAIPREHLLFTIWFLKEKRHIRTEDNSEFAISAEGVEYVESHLPAKSALRKLLRAPHDDSLEQRSEHNTTG
ncbi:MAG: DnaJ domain-containing protein [Bryobacteraceae bacterium]